MKLLLLPALAVGRTFVDDAGTRHTTDLDKPSIVVGVHDGLSLEHMGLDIAQVIGTVGERCQTGSNLNGGYYNGNLYNADGTLDHNAADHDPSHFLTDPIDANEAAMIAQAADLTPSCSASCYWCTGEEGEVVAQLDAHWDSIDFIVQGVAAGGSYYIPADLISEAEARGVPIIVLEPLWWTGGYSHSSIEITQRFEELANFLGATKDLSDDKAALCAEANTFKATAAAAAERGVRAVGTYAPYGPSPPAASLASCTPRRPMPPPWNRKRMMCPQIAFDGIHTHAEFEKVSAPPQQVPLPAARH